MKKLFILNFVCVLALNDSNAQCDSTKLCYYNRDTVSYFRNVFESNKPNYVHYPLVKMISSLEVKPLNYDYGVAYKNIDSCNRIYLYFTPSNTYNRTTKIRLKLVLYFKDLILEDSCVGQDVLDKGFWLYSTRQFYGNRIVKDFKFIEVQY